MKNAAELQAWEEYLASRYLTPNLEERMISGRVWRRSWPKTCPQCHATFYTWQADDRPHEPGAIDQESASGKTTRETCGSVHCHEEEDYRQWQARIKWRNEHPKSRQQPAQSQYSEDYL